MPNINYNLPEEQIECDKRADVLDFDIEVLRNRLQELEDERDFADLQEDIDALEAQLRDDA